MVRLNPHEFLFAAMVGVSRQIDNLTKPERRKDRYGANPEDAWRMHIEGACGEMALAKRLRLYWSGNLGNIYAADVGGLQVRTKAKEPYALIVHPPEDADGRPGDHPDHRFVLVTGTAPAFEVVGWRYGREAQRPEYWHEYVKGRPAFFVPPARLHPIDTLMEP